MIVWRVTGNEFGPGGNGACYFPTKAEAMKARRDFIGWKKSNYENDSWTWDDPPELPEKITITTREQLAYELNDAMGYGAT